MGRKPIRDPRFNAQGAVLRGELGTVAIGVAIGFWRAKNEAGRESVLGQTAGNRPVPGFGARKGQNLWTVLDVMGFQVGTKTCSQQRQKR